MGVVLLVAPHLHRSRVAPARRGRALRLRTDGLQTGMTVHVRAPMHCISTTHAIQSSLGLGWPHEVYTRHQDGVLAAT